VHKHSKLACNPCQYLEDISQLTRVNYFQFFCLEPRYDIDPRELSTQFKQYQRFIHPDKFEQAQDDLKCKA
jgi:hypothetical protein